MLFMTISNWNYNQLRVQWPYFRKKNYNITHFIIWHARQSLISHCLNLAETKMMLHLFIKKNYIKNILSEKVIKTCMNYETFFENFAWTYLFVRFLITTYSTYDWMSLVVLYINQEIYCESLRVHGAIIQLSGWKITDK